MLVALERGGVEEPGEPAEAAEDLGATGAAHVGLHQLDGAVPRLDVDAGCGVGALLGHYLSSSLSSSAWAGGMATGYCPSKQARHRLSAGTWVASVSPSSEM